MHLLPKVWDSQFQVKFKQGKQSWGISHYSPCKAVVSATPEAQDWSLTVTPEQCPLSGIGTKLHILALRSF